LFSTLAQTVLSVHTRSELDSESEALKLCHHMTLQWAQGHLTVLVLCADWRPAMPKSGPWVLTGIVAPGPPVPCYNK
jgi:hypothetical protein